MIKTTLPNIGDGSSFPSQRTKIPHAACQKKKSFVFFFLIKNLKGKCPSDIGGACTFGCSLDVFSYFHMSLLVI